MFFNNLFMSIRLMKIETPGSHYFSFFALISLLTQACLHFCRTGQLTSSEHAKYTLIIYDYICFPLCAHILYFVEIDRYIGLPIFFPIFKHFTIIGFEKKKISVLNYYFCFFFVVTYIIIQSRL